MFTKALVYKMFTSPPIYTLIYRWPSVAWFHPGDLRFVKCRLELSVHVVQCVTSDWDCEASGKPRWQPVRQCGHFLSFTRTFPVIHQDISHISADTVKLSLPGAGPLCDVQKLTRKHLIRPVDTHLFLVWESKSKFLL